MNVLSVLSPGRTEPLTLYEQYLYHAVTELIYGNIVEAKVHLHSAIAEYTESAPAYNLLGVAEAMQGNTSKAQRYFRVALVWDPTYEPAHANLVRPASVTDGYNLGIG